ncbi:MAG: Fe2+-dependent dioxygenase [Gammaproteobacteria bacterium]|nr:Fe2+-dependent dioxygenase [Gammaproteobacteria bacterium]MDH5801653.1 Fe2+-dependent dioxygenase [Gammaproteobacteria bacterium]
MLLTIADVLDPAKLENIRATLLNCRFVDGKISAGSAAEKVKNNEEMVQGTKQADYLDHLLMGSLAENALFRSAALPFRVAQPVFAQYGPGMQYGNHVDDPIMGSGAVKFRTDVSITVFLNDPNEYEGGELVINSTFGEQKIKCPAGHAVLYPSTSLHRVAEVTKGQRLVAVVWLQSMVRDPARRELLFELDQARNVLLAEHPQTPETEQVDRSYVNLLRMWAEV